MPPRALEFFDLPKLPFYRDKMVALDSRWILTRGNPLRAGSFLSYLNPKRRIYTAILEKEEGTTLGGMVQHPDESFARLTYLAAEHFSASPLALIDHLSTHAGLWRAHQVVAEITESHALFSSLRQCGFSVYSRQRIWKLNEMPQPKHHTPLWHRQKEIDLIPIQTLQAEIVPPLLQPIEFFSPSPTGMVCQADESLAYVDCAYGSQGVFLRPLIHPNTDDMREKLFGLLGALPNRRGLPVYLCVRSYQAWIEPILEEMGAKASESQAVMVKRLVKPRRKSKTVPSGGNTAWAKPAASIQRVKKTGGN